MNSEQVLQGESLQAIKFSNKLLNKLSKSGVGKKGILLAAKLLEEEGEWEISKLRG